MNFGMSNVKTPVLAVTHVAGRVVHWVAEGICHIRRNGEHESKKDTASRSKKFP